MKQLTMTLPGKSRSYEILIGSGLLDQCGEKIRSRYPQVERVAIITDSHVAPLYGEKVQQLLEQQGFQVKTVVFPAGEASKNMTTLAEIYDGLLSSQPFALTRGDLVIALGGGVTGDMGGFAAGTILRGVPLIQIPTTLLAQVDSSVGGKVAIDLKQGKNLAGMFYQPRLVLIDPDTLDTLPDRVFWDGMGEVIKYGLIQLPHLLELLEAHPSRTALRPFMEEIISASCDCKRQVVEMDEEDTGWRMILNFGHTLGHAYEKLGHYETYMHGEAVCCGMVSILRIGEQQGLTKPGTADRLIRLLEQVGLPAFADSVPQDALLETLSFDKKGAGSRITPVFCKEPGQVELHPMEKQEFARWVAEMRAEG